MKNKKDKEGHRVMLRLSKWHPATKNLPARWDESEDKLERLYDYCCKDVEAEREIHDTLGDLPFNELAVFQLDMTVNERGIPIDLPAVEAAIEFSERYTELETARLLDITDGKVQTANQLAKFLKWLNEEGVNIASLSKESVAEALGGTLTDAARQALLIRQKLSRSSIKKYYAMRDRACADGRLRGELIYHRAHTGRWGGTGVQVQNLPRGTISHKHTDHLLDLILWNDVETVEMIYGSPSDALASTIRAMVKAPEGRKFIIADFAGVEARGLAWLSGQESLVQLFRDGADVYKEMASEIFGVATQHVSKDQRFVGKTAILGLGYGMGWKVFQATCDRYGPGLTDDMAETAVATYRGVNFKTVNWWRDLERAAIQAVDEGRKVDTTNASFHLDNSFLTCTLPSGRELHYRNPVVLDEMTPWGTETQKLMVEAMSPPGKGPPRWCRISMWGGIWAENITQAVCRDLLVHSMFELEEAGYEIIFHVHDEIICEVSEDFGSADEMCNIMCQLPDWAWGFPLEAEGFETERFRK